MSLISDPDYLIHSLRLNYLRHVDDPYASSIISLDPYYDSNPYIVASGLADVEKWPELARPSSPTPSDDEGRINAHSGFPGATRLKYTTTIMGPSRMGGMGLRVAGKRASMSKSSYRFSVRYGTDTPRPTLDEKTEPEVHDASAAEQSTATTASGSITSSVADTLKLPEQEAPKDVNGSIDNGAPQEGAEPPKTISPEFHPKFKGAAEMEARRKLRMQARARPVPGIRVPNPPVLLNPEISSSESESEEDEEADVEPNEEDDEFDLNADVDDSIDIDADESDQDFPATRGMPGLEDIHSDSDGVSILSGTNSVMSTTSSMMGSSLQPSNSARVGTRLSPVHESRISEETSVDVLPDRPEESAPIESGFDMVIPAPKPKPQRLSQAAAPAAPAEPAHAAHTDDLFTRRAVLPTRPGRSALAALLADSSGTSSSNPFAELYSAISARAEGDSMGVNVYFPHAREPAGRALTLKVRRDASVEEVLGFALWTYWEEGWLPKIDEGLEGEEDARWETRCSAVGWILRIAEEDGEVDEDFPPPDRTGKISKFNFDAYAVLEATASQVQQNKVLESKIQRRLSRIVVKKKKSTGLLNAMPTPATLAPPADSFLGTSAGISSLVSSIGMFPSSLGPSSSHGQQQFLRIRIADMADAGLVSITIPATSGMYTAEVLELACQKRKLNDPKDYALVLDLGPTKVFIPLDKTVKSLQGKRDLILMKRDMLREYGVEISSESSRTTDPNASIIKRNSEILEPSFNSMFDYTNAYKKYTVYRKVPMLVTRSARLLAIDGVYIHIMPMSNKAKHVFDSGKTSSYHLKSVVACQQSSKDSSTFKLVVHSNAERDKRYDFEAESPKLAYEIVQTIRALKISVERPGTIKQSRRSRQVT